MPALKDFMQVNPMVNIDIDLEDSVTNLTEQRIDLAIRIAADPDPSLIGKPIAICESVIVAAPEYLLGKKKITKPQDLVHHECLGYKNFERHIWHLSKKNKFESVDINCRLTANEATALLHAALCGAGISLQPTYLANKYIQKKELSQILPDWKPNALKIYALYASRKHIPPAVRALIDHLTEYFKHNPW